MNIPTGGGGASPGGFDIQRLLNLVFRHSWVIIVTFVVVTVSGVLFFHEQQEAEYESTAVVMVRPTSSNALASGSDAMTMWAAVLDWQRYRSTQLRIMTSSVILSKVVQQLDLQNDPLFPTGGIVGGDSSAPVGEGSGPHSLRALVNILKQSITVEQEGDTMMINITARCAVPHYCADIANSIAKTYMEFNVEQLVGSGVAAENWLRTQYESRRKVLRDSEDALVEFRSDRNLISVSLEDQYNITGRNLSSLAEKLLEAQYQVDSLEVTMSEIARVRASEDYLSAGLIEVVDNSVVQQLKQQLTTLDTERASMAVVYGDQHPNMKANAEKRRLVEESLVREIDAELSSQQLRYETGKSLVRAIEEKMRANYADAMDMGDEQVQYERLVRETEINRGLVSKIEEKLHSVELANKLEPQNIQVMEYAPVPASPIYSKNLPTTLIAAGLGLVLGLGMAFVLEALDNTVSSHEEIEQDFELPFLGIVPTMNTGRHRDMPELGPTRGETFNPDTFVVDYPRSSVAEAMRSIRTNLAFMMSEEPLKKVLITSAVPLAGKSTFAISLATIMGQVGKKVVLVDNDLRKARLHKALNIDATEGLTSVLSGEATIDDVLYESSIPGVTVMPCGPTPADPAELIMSSAYADVLETLEERFDIVILDAPPVQPVTDAVQLSKMVDGTIIVVRARKTRKNALQSTVDKLDAVGAPIAGVVLNDVDIQSRRKGYYYTYGYYGGYYGRTD